MFFLGAISYYALYLPSFQPVSLSDIRSVSSLALSKHSQPQRHFNLLFSSLPTLSDLHLSPIMISSPPLLLSSSPSLHHILHPAFRPFLPHLLWWTKKTDSILKIFFFFYRQKHLILFFPHCWAGPGRSPWHRVPRPGDRYTIV